MSRGGAGAGARAALARAAAAVALLLLLGGPTPGAIGSCSGEGKLEAPADLQTFCKLSEQYKCVRRALRKEISNQARDDCRRAAITQCGLRSWAPGCHPTQRQANACLNALRSLDTLSTKEADIAECNTGALCAAKLKPSSSGGAAGAGADAGADAGTDAGADAGADAGMDAGMDVAASDAGADAAALDGGAGR